MPKSFRVGDQVYWWKRITNQIEFPYRATVLALGKKRIQIAVEESTGMIRHVSGDRLQLVGKYHTKAVNQKPTIEPQNSWGKFTRYLEIDEDLRAIRQIDVFKNGNKLSYDRCHWVDDFGMLSDGRINRNRKRGPWGQAQEIHAREFEEVWKAARKSPIWKQQTAKAQMTRMGTTPVWLTISE